MFVLTACGGGSSSSNPQAEVFEDDPPGTTDSGTPGASTIGGSTDVGGGTTDIGGTTSGDTTGGTTDSGATSGDTTGGGTTDSGATSGDTTGGTTDIGESTSGDTTGDTTSGGTDTGGSTDGGTPVGGSASVRELVAISNLSCNAPDHEEGDVALTLMNGIEYATWDNLEPAEGNFAELLVLLGVTFGYLDFIGPLAGVGYCAHSEATENSCAGIPGVSNVRVSGNQVSFDVTDPESELEASFVYNDPIYASTSAVLNYTDDNTSSSFVVTRADNGTERAVRNDSDGFTNVSTENPDCSGSFSSALVEGGETVQTIEASWTPANVSPMTLSYTYCDVGGLVNGCATGSMIGRE